MARETWRGSSVVAGLRRRVVDGVGGGILVMWGMWMMGVVAVVVATRYGWAAVVVLERLCVALEL